MEKNSVILLIIDGLGDLPTPKTPLQAAKKPNIDRLAKEGITGLFSPIKRGMVPGSDTSHLRIFGYDPDIFYPGRGPLEALGVGINLKEGDIAFRANFATIKDGRIIDRRAGRIETTEAKSLEKYLNTRIEDVDIIYKHSVDHRGAVVFRGPKLSDRVCDSDPHIIDSSIINSFALDKSPEAEKTARILNRYMEYCISVLSKAEENKKREQNGKLPANALLLRGAGTYTPVPSITKRFCIKGVCIAGGALYRGVARYVGMDVIMLPSKEDDKILQERAYAAVKATNDYDLVFLHVKGCDNAGHDGNFEQKKKTIEAVDRNIIPIIAKSGASIIITGDHSTPVSRKEHSGHEVPILIWSKEERKDNVKKFDEMSCMNGGLGHIRGKDLMPIILNILKKAEKYGS
ncbi:MAG: 2,3-bisphosphoglycerate-independent phosphoglycerate mutase [Candidatus Bilamarchaeaceae archaeon]